MASFVDLLKGIYSSNQQQIKYSTDEYKRMAAETPNELVMSLLETMSTHLDVKVRVKSVPPLNGLRFSEPVCERTAKKRLFANWVPRRPISQFLEDAPRYEQTSTLLENSFRQFSASIGPLDALCSVFGPSENFPFLTPPSVCIDVLPVIGPPSLCSDDSPRGYATHRLLVGQLV